MLKLMLFIVSVVILTLPIAVLGCAVQQQELTNANILIHVHVLKDQPEPSSEYELREGEPKNVGVYEFYLKEPGIPGSGTFKKLDSISLDKVTKTEFYGRKLISRIDGNLCVGYPSTNVIDGKACVRVDQSQNEVNITLHYWKTSLGITFR